MAGPDQEKVIQNQPLQTADGEDVDFAAIMKRLEDIVKSLEGGALSLEDSLKGFEEGVRLARHLESILDGAEKKVEEILNPQDQEE